MLAVVCFYFKDNNLITNLFGLKQHNKVRIIKYVQINKTT